MYICYSAKKIVTKMLLKDLNHFFRKIHWHMPLAFYSMLWSPGKQNYKFQDFKLKKNFFLTSQRNNHFKMQASEMKLTFLHRAGSTTFCHLLARLLKFSHSINNNLRCLEKRKNIETITRNQKINDITKFNHYNFSIHKWETLSTKLIAFKG